MFSCDALDSGPSSFNSFLCTLVADQRRSFALLMCTCTNVMHHIIDVAHHVDAPRQRDVVLGTNVMHKNPPHT